MNLLLLTKRIVHAGCLVFVCLHNDCHLGVGRHGDCDRYLLLNNILNFNCFRGRGRGNGGVYLQWLGLSLDLYNLLLFDQGMMHNIGVILIRRVSAMLLERLCFGLTCCVWAGLLEDGFHIRDGRLLSIPRRSISLVDILIVVKEAIINVEGESVRYLLRRHLPRTAWPLIRKCVSIRLAGRTLIASSSHV